MAIQQLLATNKLSAELLSTHKNWGISSFLDFDRMSDDLFLLFIKSSEEHVVHYIDENVAVLYKPDTYDVVGIQIDNFEAEFSKVYFSKDKEWKFANKGEKGRVSWILSLYFDESQKGLCVLLEKEDVFSNIRTIIDICYPLKTEFRQNRKPNKSLKYFFDKTSGHTNVKTGFTSKLLVSISFMLVLFVVVLPLFSSDVLFAPTSGLEGGAGGNSTFLEGIAGSNGGSSIGFLIALPILLVLYAILISKKKK